jgi:hypothetical protein
VAVFCVATAGSLLSQALDGQSPVAPRPDGFVFCSDHDNGQPVPLYGRCRKRQIGSLNCGEKVTVVARSDDMLRVLLAGGFPRYVALSAISRQPDKFVPFDKDPRCRTWARSTVLCLRVSRWLTDSWFVRIARIRRPYISARATQSVGQPRLRGEGRCASPPRRHDPDFDASEWDAPLRARVLCFPETRQVCCL